MKKLFQYNWTVRDEWFMICEKLSREELTKTRTGGMESILRTLFHIIDVEISWARAILGKDDVLPAESDYTSIQDLRKLSEQYREDVIHAVSLKRPDLVKPDWMDQTFPKEDILRHILAHEIHHMGQLSVWAREIGIEPVSANVISRPQEKAAKKQHL
ncbi:DinB family protein [Bacillus sp. NEAU-CP5]|uniref:DinB family protein n=1 Tax=Bacillus TaxID=1386 RepID=UPI000C7694D9|nr:MULTISPECIES: DinB family protein [Bacillus]MCX3307251.1 DinB family protein [Bacillus velezensis]MCX8441851.1 DinB family protein [Bacillus sp. NEAU-CP5]MEC1339298.1 DinB family protein [Bacillus velezensis]PLT48955.1 damage-inducible protein DinB [Bacillus amyloliquefaciens]ULH20001.1 DinB family protein [Bacillus velezensis]